MRKAFNEAVNHVDARVVGRSRVDVFGARN